MTTASRDSNSRLPRRISRCFLLCFALALLWIIAIAVPILHSTAQRRSDEACTERLERAAAQVPIADVRSGNVALQKLIERFEQEGGLEHCAVVSSEGKILAHSSPSMVGTIWQEPQAASTRQGDIERLRYADDSAGAVLEFRAPLRDGNRELARLHMAFPEPDLWAAAVPGTGMLLWIAAGPAVCMVVGTILLRRAVLPLAAIESELARVAVAVCPADAALREVPAGSAASLGWNRLVESAARQHPPGDLENRVAGALQSVVSKQGNVVLHSLPDGIALTDEQGRITFANLALGAICGATNGNGGLTGKTLEDLFDLGSAPAGAEAFLSAGARGRPVVAEVRSSLQGSQRVLRLARYPFWGPDGKADGGRHVWSIRDVTQVQLVAQTRDQFLQTAAHELRIPLANIKAYAETLCLDDTIDAEKQKEFYNVINSEATRLARLIEDLLNVSSMEVGALSASREETDIGRLVGEVVEKVRPLMEQKRLDLKVALPQKWPKVHLDKDKIATSLVNVLGNAAKYTPAGGRVTLRVTAVDDRQLAITVEDTGIGIAAEELPKISEKFFRSKDPRVRQQPGSGLGLSLVKEVVRLHGGTLEIQSEADKGTTVKITLPIV